MMLRLPFVHVATRIACSTAMLLCLSPVIAHAQSMSPADPVGVADASIDDPNDFDFNDIIDDPNTDFPPDDDHPSLPPTNEVQALLRLLDGPWTDGRKAVVTELVRHSGPFNEQTWWGTSPSAQSLGHVFRDSWRQVFRSHYEMIDENGTKIADAKQPWGRGNIWSSVKQLYIRDVNNALVLKAKGTFFTKARRQFRLYDAAGAHVADAWVDNSRHSVAFTYPNQRHHRIGDLVRVSANHKPGRWRLVVREPGVIPAIAWPTVSTFLAHESEAFDSYTWMAIAAGIGITAINSH